MQTLIVFIIGRHVPPLSSRPGWSRVLIVTIIRCIMAHMTVTIILSRIRCIMVHMTVHEISHPASENQITHEQGLVTRRYYWKPEVLTTVWHSQSQLHFA